MAKTREIPLWPEWMKTKTVAEYTSTTVVEVRGWLRAGLPYVRPGRAILIRRAWVDEFLESRKVCSAESLNSLVDGVINAVQ